MEPGGNTLREMRTLKWWLQKFRGKYLPECEWRMEITDSNRDGMGDIMVTVTYFCMKVTSSTVVKFQGLEVGGR